MDFKSACRLTALAISLFPLAARAQAHGSAPATSEVPPAARHDSAPGQMSEIQWLRQRVEQLEAEIASGDHCGAKGSGKAGNGAKPGMKAMKTAKSGGGVGPMGMEPMGDKMGGGMNAQPQGQPPDKMAPSAMPPPSAPPAGMGDM